MNLVLGTVATVSLGGAILLSIDRKLTRQELKEFHGFTLAMLVVVLVCVLLLLLG